MIADVSGSCHAQLSPYSRFQGGSYHGYDGFKEFTHFKCEYRISKQLLLDVG